MGIAHFSNRLTLAVVLQVLLAFVFALVLGGSVVHLILGCVTRLLGLPTIHFVMLRRCLHRLLVLKIQDRRERVASISAIARCPCFGHSILVVISCSIIVLLLLLEIVDLRLDLLEI